MNQQLQTALMLEWYLELNFTTVLAGCTPKIFRDRDPKCANADGAEPATPRIEVHITMGGLPSQGKHNYVQPSTGGMIFDAWEGELTTEVFTNRLESEQSNPPTHYVILGAIRSILYQAKIARQAITIPEWDATYLSLIDIREKESSDSTNPEQTIDSTAIKWFILIQANTANLPK